MDDYRKYSELELSRQAMLTRPVPPPPGTPAYHFLHAGPYDLALAYYRGALRCNPADVPERNRDDIQALQDAVTEFVAQSDSDR